MDQQKKKLLFLVVLTVMSIAHGSVVENISCNRVDSARSGYQQWLQLELISEDSSVRSSLFVHFSKPEQDEDTMMNTLQYCNPCAAGGTEVSGRCFIPEQGQFEFIVDRFAMNGWAFQSHYDCVVAAITGAINAACHCSREKPLYSTDDIRKYLIHIEQQAFFLYFHKFVKQNPSSDMSPLVTYLISREYSAFFEKDEIAWMEQIKDKELVEKLRNYDDREKMFDYFETVTKLKKAQTESSKHHITGVINSLGLGLSASLLHEYTWIELKNFLKRDDVTLMIRLPHHVALVFAAGEDKKTGKQRHVLVGRPSGGQSPSGWIPWGYKDIVPGETLWQDDVSLVGGIESEINRGLTMYLNADSTSHLQSFYICQRELIIIKREGSCEQVDLNWEIEKETEWDDKLRSTPLMYCSTCVKESKGSITKVE